MGCHMATIGESMWSDRSFKAAIDRHVQGIYHPSAPWNQPDYYDPMCDLCEVEDCIEPCADLLKRWEEDQKEIDKIDRSMYMFFLLELTEEKALQCDEAVLIDWVGLRNLGFIP